MPQPKILASFLAFGLLTAGMALTACQAPLPSMATPSSVSPQGLSLRVRPVLNDGMRLLAATPLKTAADVDALEIHLQVKAGSGGYLPIDAATGEPSAETTNPLKLRVEGPLDPTLSLTFNHLKRETEYRILARAFDGAVQISEDEHSSVVVPVGTSPNLGPVEVPLRLVTPFGAQTQVSLDLWGLHAKITRVRVSLSNPAQGVVAELDLPRANLGKAMTLASLRANTPYTLDLTAYAQGSLTPIGTASTLIPVATEESVASRSIPMTITGDMVLGSDLDLVAVDGAGNLHVAMSRIGSVTDLVRYSRDGSVTTLRLPYAVKSFDVAPNGTRYVVTRDERALRILSDAGDFQVLVSSGATCLDVDAEGNCYTAGNSVIRKFAPGLTTGMIVARDFPYLSDALYAAPDGVLYLSVNSAGAGFYRIPSPNAEPEWVAPAPSTWARAMTTYTDGRILAAIDRNGLWALDLAQGIWSQVLPPSQAGGGLAKDVKGNFYVTGNGTLRVF